MAQDVHRTGPNPFPNNDFFFTELEIKKACQWEHLALHTLSSKLV